MTVCNFFFCYCVSEYADLDSTLDKLGSCLDQLESRNDDLFSRMQALLEDSKKAREELQACAQQQQHSENTDKLENLDLDDNKPEESKEEK